MNVLLSILIIIFVISIAIYAGIHLAPVIIRVYLRLLESLAKMIKQPTYSRQKEIASSKPQVHQIHNIKCVQNLRQPVERINEPVKQGNIPKFNNTSHNKLDGSCLNMPPKPIINGISNPITKAIPHAETLSQGEKASQPNGNDTISLTRNGHPPPTPPFPFEM